MELNKYFDIHFERADDATIAKRLIGGAKVKGPALVILILSMFIASIGLNCPYRLRLLFWHLLYIFIFPPFRQLHLNY